MHRIHGIDGRRLTFALAALAFAGSMVAGSAGAQDDLGTPPATENPPSFELTIPAAQKTAIAVQVQQVTDSIALVVADRDAVADSTDVTEVDALLVEARKLRDSVQAALSGSNLISADDDLARAVHLTLAARQLLEAELSAYGLPSQQAGASVAITSAFYAVEAAASDPSISPEVLAIAKRLYARAYDRYNAGVYAQAGGIAGVVEQIVSPGLFASPHGTFSVGEGSLAGGGEMPLIVEGSAIAPSGGVSICAAGDSVAEGGDPNLPIAPASCAADVHVWDLEGGATIVVEAFPESVSNVGAFSLPSDSFVVSGGPSFDLGGTVVDVPEPFVD